MTRSLLLHARAQRGRLKGVQRKLLDFGHTLGLSNSVMRLIENRQTWDKLLVYSGMLLTLALLWFVFFYRRSQAEE